MARTLLIFLTVIEHRVTPRCMDAFSNCVSKFTWTLFKVTLHCTAVNYVVDLLSTGQQTGIRHYQCHSTAYTDYKWKRCCLLVVSDSWASCISAVYPTMRGHNAFQLVVALNSFHVCYVKQDNKQSWSLTSLPATIVCWLKITLRQKHRKITQRQ